ncbi:hypothetical protein Vafri_11759 [Volvox africanus]|uniref:Uncharacterized protein n=1 Tax=Volvox africanus TaxID=51714 RepID=A0A8J4B8V3_9CHLO|nr:hypothetical protein Vafri_11759 [Volvox africanus]
MATSSSPHALDAGRDLPHLRPDCTVHRFNFGVFKSNYRHCAQCYCYACDVKASECKFWGTGLNAEDHANARPLVHWNRMRMAARQAGSPLAAATTAVTSAAVGGIKNPGSDQGPSGSAEGGGHLEARRVSRRQVDNGKKAPMKAAADRQKTFDAAAAAVAVAIITTAAAMEKRNSAPVRSRASVRAAAMVPAAMVATAPRTPASPTSSTEGCITRSKPRKSGNTRKAK